jgi:MFS family permease
VRVKLPEPRTFANFVRSTEQESTSRTLNYLRQKRTIVGTVAGSSLYAVFAFGIMGFIPSFMVRSLHVPIAEIGALWGTVIGVANILGAGVGGWLADRFSRSDVRWFAWLPAAACVLGLPLYWIALHTHNWQSFVAVEAVAEFVISTGICVCIMPIFAVCGSTRRALASAVLLCCMTLVGATFGPLLAGWLSDLFEPAYGAESLRYSLTVVCAFLLPAAGAFAFAGRSIRKELEA